ncbi:NUDIX hydrolase [Altererythrobacter sp. Root672]|uniref:NUDIX hydrolase n=1 Tax=Altererythrobacter sp. Root672 TaxID=1736584 RepID=UPI0007000D79|nr:NUDIX hydrolase [Altererythrobacter sp. Root672]KRA83933.1 NUDIX hydrolase [Altererythrobacter sp. Root672]
MTERPLPPDADAPEQLEWAGKWIQAKRRGRWEYATRSRGIRAAVILAVDAGDVILVEQYRVAIGKFCLELPAGLIGDEDEGEDDLTSARRELEEETGYQAAQWETVGEFYSSPGMVQESFTLLKATGLSQVHEGGGTEHEEIVVHRVPLARIGEVIAEHRAKGHGIDVKLAMLLGPLLLEDAAQ